MQCTSSGRTSLSPLPNVSEVNLLKVTLKVIVFKTPYLVITLGLWDPERIKISPLYPRTSSFLQVITISRIYYEKKKSNCRELGSDPSNKDTLALETLTYIRIH